MQVQANPARQEVSDAVQVPGVVEQAGQAVSDAGKLVRQTAQETLPPTPQVVPGTDLGSILLIAVMLLATIAMRWGLDVIADQVRSRTAGVRRNLLEIILRCLSYLILLGGLFVVLGLLNLPTEPYDWALVAWRIYLTLVVIFGAVTLYRIITILLHIGMRRARGYGVMDLQLETMLRDVLRFFAIAAGIILVVQAWGYNATALVAGLGLGGLALAFAAQNTIANVFGSIVIYSERPYAVGDWVTIGDAEGIVEHIGMRSTRIRRWDKTVAIVPNKRVTEDIISNNSALTHRRIRFHLALKYTVDAHKMRLVLEELTKLVGEHPGITDHWLHVRLERFTPISQDILIQAYCGTADYGDFLIIQEELLLKVREKVDQLGAEIAVPTGTVVSGGGGV